MPEGEKVPEELDDSEMFVTDARADAEKVGVPDSLDVALVDVDREGDAVVVALRHSVLEPDMVGVFETDEDSDAVCERDVVVVDVEDTVAVDDALRLAVLVSVSEKVDVGVPVDVSVAETELEMEAELVDDPVVVDDSESVEVGEGVTQTEAVGEIELDADRDAVEDTEFVDVDVDDAVAGALFVGTKLVLPRTDAERVETSDDVAKLETVFQDAVADAEPDCESDVVVEAQMEGVTVAERVLDTELLTDSDALGVDVVEMEEEMVDD